ncbi:hypothetical protein LA331_04305 [Acinetobacter variabilis]|nr:hypothetical protein LA331_04305 [Acinetobacter variabilis]
MQTKPCKSCNRVQL